MKVEKQPRTTEGTVVRAVISSTRFSRVRTGTGYTLGSRCRWEAKGEWGNYLKEDEAVEVPGERG
jgi:hypothetical protein